MVPTLASRADRREFPSRMIINPGFARWFRDLEKSLQLGAFR
jgi:hypothetical protein